MNIGERIHRVELCSSTNDLMQALALKGAEEGTVIVASGQKKGRGTKKRQWYSLQGKGLYFSVLLRPKRKEGALIPLLAGVAVSEAISEACQVQLQIKWPNDLLWEKRKIGGILSESSFSGERLSYVILGVGLNLTQNKKDFPAQLQDSAVSLLMATGKNFSSDLILDASLKSLQRWYCLFKEGEDERILRAIEHLNIFSRGEEVEMETENGWLRARFLGLDKFGRMVLEAEGKQRPFLSAEIISPVKYSRRK